MIKKTFILIILYFYFCNYSFAEFYKWTDDKGVFHATNSIGSVPEKYKDKITTKINTESSSKTADSSNLYECQDMEFDEMNSLSPKQFEILVKDYVSAGNNLKSLNEKLDKENDPRNNDKMMNVGSRLKKCVYLMGRAKRILDKALQPE